MARRLPSRAAASHCFGSTSVFELQPRWFATCERLLNDMRNLLRASRTGSMSFFVGNGARACARSRVRRNGTSNLAPLWATQMSKRSSSATSASVTWRSLERQVDHVGLSLSARNTFGRPLAGFTTPHKITPKSALRLVVSKSNTQHVTWFISRRPTPLFPPLARGDEGGWFRWLAWPRDRRSAPSAAVSMPCFPIRLPPGRARP
jgi:hypothetical protein